MTQPIRIRQDYVEHAIKLRSNIGADRSLMLFGVAKGATTFADALAAEQQAIASQFGIAASEPTSSMAAAAQPPARRTGPSRGCFRTLPGGANNARTSN